MSSVINQSLVLSGRSLVKSARNPGAIVNGVMTPVLFLVLFVYLFGGAVAGSTNEYLQYVFPGVLVMGTSIAGMVSSGLTINIDMKKGVYDRFRSLPIGRSAPLLGSILADFVRYLIVVAVLFIIGFLLGFRVTTDPGSALAAVGIALLFGFALSWLTVFLGVLIRDENAVMAISFFMFIPLTMGTSLVAPTDTLPGWLQAWADVNPATHVMDAVRGLLTGDIVGADLGGSIGLAVIWSLGLMVVFCPLAVAAFNRRE